MHKENTNNLLYYHSAIIIINIQYTQWFFLYRRKHAYTYTHAYIHIYKSTSSYVCIHIFKTLYYNEQLSNIYIFLRTLFLTGFIIFLWEQTIPAYAHTIIYAFNPISLDIQLNLKKWFLSIVVNLTLLKDGITYSAVMTPLIVLLDCIFTFLGS